MSSDPLATSTAHPPAPAEDVSKPVGVVFVHGIGSQTQSAAVREFGQPLIDWLAAWHRANEREGFRVVSADLSYGGALEGPARFRLQVPQASGGTRTWVLTEAWWSTRLVAPEYGRMLLWSARILLRAIGQLAGQSWLRVVALAKRLVGQPVPRAVSDIGPLGWFIDLLATLLLTLEYALAGIAGYLLLIVLLPLSYIPIQAVRDFVLVRLVRPFLVDNIGDFETFVEDDVQALNIRRSLERAIDYLKDKEGCGPIVVAAHSQGAVVAFDALCSRGRTGFPEVTKLITFGGALNKAFLLQPDCVRLQGSLPDHIFWLDVWSYFDPVPGGKLERQGGDLLVHPGGDLRWWMHWHADGGDGPMQRTTLNRMNVAADHDLYWDNWEHFTQRVVQEVDRPLGYYHESQFYRSDEVEKEYSRRRRLRLATLVGWRLAAMYLYLIAVIARFAHGGVQQLAQDGRTVAAFVSQIPGVQILSIPGEILSAIGTAVHLVAGALAPVPGGPSIVDRIAVLVDPGRYETLAYAALGLLTFALVVAACYLALSFVFFKWWDEGERLASVKAAPRTSMGYWLTYWTLLSVKSVVIVGALFAVGYLVATP
jgi:hypothetical protein